MARPSRYGALFIPSGSHRSLVGESEDHPSHGSTPAFLVLSRRGFRVTGLSWIAILLVATLLSACRVQTPTPTPVNRPPLIYPTDTPAPVIVETSTSQPTIQPTQTASPTASPTPPVAFLEVDPKPPIRFDLIYLSDERLMRWDHIRQSQEALINQVITYTLSTDGSQIALLRAKGITANGIEMYDLERLDLETRQIQILIDDLPKAGSLSLSPDNQWLAYAIPGDDPTIHIVANTDDPARQTLATCQSSHPSHCTNLIWSPKSRELAWSDREGLWRYDLGSHAPRLILPAQAAIPDPRGNSTQVSVRYQSLSWSPFGRYILSEIVVPASDVRWWGIADTTLQRLALLPDSFTTQPPRISAIWTQDGKVFVTRPSHFVENQAPVIELWIVTPTYSDLLILDRKYTLPPMEIYTSQRTVSRPDFSLERPFQANDYTFRLAAYTTGEPVLSALMNFDLRFGILEKTNDLIVAEQNLLWAPDGSSLLLGEIEPKWIPVGSPTLYDLQAAIGAQTCCFSWTPDR